MILKKMILLLFVIHFFSPNLAKSQSYHNYSHKNEVELKLGGELYRKAFVGGLGYNISLSRKFVFTPQIEKVGTIILSASLKYQLQVKKIKLIPLVSIGVIPMILFYIPIGNIGCQISYQFNKTYDIFLEAKVYAFHSKVNSIGSENFKKKNVHEYPPIVIMVGIRF